MDYSYQYIKIIEHNLFSNERRRLQSIIKTMFERNTEATGKLSDGFLYKGMTFRPDTAWARGKPTLIGLDYSLHEDMEKYLKGLEKIENDQTWIRQILYKLLEPCFNYQDVRDAIPECIIDTLPDEVKKLQRCRNPTFFLNHPRDFKQYEKVLPLLEFYSAARLLY